MTKATTNRPTHRIYAVTGRNSESKGHWAEIGAAWPHQDGKGFNLRLGLLPLDPSAELVIREAKEKGDR